MVSVDMENLMPIGEFAAASRLSQKARRLYGEKGLLPPTRRLLKEEQMYDVLTRQQGEQAYVSRTRRVLVPDLEPFIVDAFRELGRDGADGPGFVLYHGPVNAEEDGPVEVCVPADGGEHSLPAGEVAFTEINGRQCQFPEILGAYDAVYRWARDNGREPGGPAREIYLSGPGGDERLQIAVPLR